MEPATIEKGSSRKKISIIYQRTLRSIALLLAIVAVLVVALAALLLEGLPLTGSKDSGDNWPEAELANRTDEYSLQSVLVPPPPEINLADIVSLLERDSIQAIDNPRFVSAEQAARFITPDERVIGMSINGDARAYPIPVLSVHEIVNDIVGGEPVAVTWCPLCYTALVFSRTIPGSDESVSFGVSGKLLHETLVMYDRESDSLWSQLYGAAIDGPYAGSRLSFYPSSFMRWTDWVELHPHTLVLDKESTCQRFQCGTYASNPRGSYDVDPYESYYNEPGAGVVNSQIPRDAEQTTAEGKERVLGIRLAGTVKAYPYSQFPEPSVFNDSVNEVPVVIWLDSGSHSGFAYLRTAASQVLSFHLAGNEKNVMVDEETGSSWDLTRGIAVSGPMAGVRLEPVFSTTAFAFGWYDYFPESLTYSPDQQPSVE